MGFADFITAASTAPFIYILGAVSINILRIILTNVAKFSKDDAVLNEPFDQLKPFLQQANHILNTVLFPSGVSVTFQNVLAASAVLVGIAMTTSFANGVYTIRQELRAQTKSSKTR